MINTTLSHYRITAKLGQGGMGEVYRATDSKLDREVAIKVLPEGFDQEANVLTRFEREAKTLAQLNHPHVAAVHGFDEWEGKHFLVLELVEGEDLSARLKREALPVEEALQVGRQIAEALEAAHEKGIIHRDLKPGNIKLTEDGQVKVLDFGLAKVSAAASAAREGGEGAETCAVTVAEETTIPGLVLGTAGYMSPEQARGQEVDKRADIWSFGAVLFECLSGQRVFQGKTVTDTIGEVLQKEPDWSVLPKTTPPTIQLLLRKCLTKDRRRRLHDIADARVDLELAIADPGGFMVKFDGEMRSGLSRRMVLPWAVAGVAILVAAAALIPFRQNHEGSAVSNEATVEAGPLRKLELPLLGIGDGTKDRIMGMSISPDGRKLAYVTLEGLWLKALDRFDPPELLAPSARAAAPFWSPDSAHIAWFDHATLKRVSTDDRRPRTICPITSRFPRGNIAGGGWLENQEIIFATGYGGLFRVPAGGGEAEEFLRPTEEEDDYHEAAALPDRKGVVFIVHRNNADGRSDYAMDTIAVWRLGDGTTGKKIVYQDEGTGIYNVAMSSSGHLLFLNSRTSPLERTAWALPFSVDTLNTTGEPFRLNVDGGHLSVSQEGTLALAGSSARPPMQMVWIDRAGQLGVPFGPVREHAFGTLQLSPDERSVAYSVADVSATRPVAKIWIANLQQGTALPFTEEGESERKPFWLPNARELAFTKSGGRFSSSRGESSPELHVRVIDGFEPGRTLVTGFFLEHLSPSGNYALLEQFTNSIALNFYAHLSQSPIVPTPYPGRYFEGVIGNSQLSPDDTILAYSSDESGEREVYTVAFPGFTNRVVISRSGGDWPVWRPDGKELFFLSKDRRSLMTAPFLNQDSRLFGEPVKLFDFPASVLRGSSFAPAKDGERFLVWQEVQGDREGVLSNLRMSVLLIENWLEEYRQAP